MDKLPATKASPRQKGGLSPPLLRLYGPSGGYFGPGGFLARGEFLKRSGRWLFPLALVAVMLGLWEAGVWYWEFPHYILPAPSEIGAMLIEKRAVFLRNTGITALEVLAGGLLGIAVGGLLGVFLFWSETFEKAFYPLLITSQNVPVFAIAPLLVVWFGYGLASKVVMAAIIVFFPIALAMLNGLKRTDPELIRLFRTMGASPWQMLWKLRFPAALPALFAGLKLSAIYATIGAVLGEWVGAQGGLGYLMLSANAQLRIAMVFGAIFCLTPIGLSLLGLITWLEHRLLPWQHASRDESPPMEKKPPETLGNFPKRNP